MGRDSMDERDDRFWREDDGLWDRTRTRWDKLSGRTRKRIVRVSLTLLLIAALTLFNLVTSVEWPGQ
jgi:hypothetical protein